MTSPTRNKSEPLREEDVQGLKYFNKLGPLLREVGCQRDKAERAWGHSTCRDFCRRLG